MAPCIKYGGYENTPPIYLIHGKKTKDMLPSTRVDILKIFFHTSYLIIPFSFWFVENDEKVVRCTKKVAPGL